MVLKAAASRLDHDRDWIQRHPGRVQHPARQLNSRTACVRHWHDVVGLKDQRHHQEPQPLHPARRMLLSAAAAAVVAGAFRLPAEAMDLHSVGVRSAVDAEAYSQQQLQAFFQDMVVVIKQQLGGGFDARLVFYTAMADLPSGIPGDPAQDVASKRSKACGRLRDGGPSPYALCPAPGSEPPDGLVRQCCRHFAYAVPKSRFAFARADRVHTVVASLRMTRLQQRSWRAMLLHELGHCIDFHVFGGRYGLLDSPPLSEQLAARLSELDAAASDPELRADLLGQELLGAAAGGQLCYDSVTTLQVLLPPGTACRGTGQPGDPEPLLHFSHPPLQGQAPGAARST